MSRRRKIKEQDGDRSHIPREERSYVEYHPRLLTHLALTIVKQATEQPRRRRSAGHVSRTNGGRDSVSSVSNPPTVNGEIPTQSHYIDVTTTPPSVLEISPDNEEAHNDDLYAFGQITGTHNALQSNGIVYGETAGNAFEIDPSLGMEEGQTGNASPLTTTMAIDPVLLADFDEIATPAPDQHKADNVPPANSLILSTPTIPKKIQIPEQSNGHGDQSATRLSNARTGTVASSDRFLRSEVSVEEKYERLRREGGFSIGKLHEPTFRRLDNATEQNKVKLTSNAIAFGYQADRPYVRTQNGYTRTIDLPESDLTDRVEYDMDEQDDHWLGKYNERRLARDGDTISREIFEITLTKIEKEWTALEKRIPKPERKEEAVSEDAKCAICDDGECENTNAIVFCDGCNLAVHQECYGVPYIPEGQWLCRKCFASPVDPVSCVFCPSKQGAFKQTSDLHWAHLLCTSWIPEVNVGNYVFMEPVEGVSNIPSSRWKLTCYVCKLKMGACIQCSNKTCYTPFHVSCARRARLFLQRDPTNPTAVPKSYCDKHVPDWYAETVDVKASLREAQSYFATHTDIRGQNLVGGETPSRGQFIISLKRSKQNAVIPAIVFAEILLYMRKFRIRNKADFIADLCKYWSLKRRSRRGVSLLKRLQLQIEDNANQKMDEKSTLEKLRFMKTLLVELESYQKPLLDDLMERETLKKERCEMRNSVILSLYLPLQSILLETITACEQADTQNMLSTIQVPRNDDSSDDRAIGWNDIVDKATTAQYATISAFESDVEFMIQDILKAFPEVAHREHRFINRFKDRLKPVLARARRFEASRSIDKSRSIATCFDADFEPDGLVITEEKPFNWANRDASPLSDLDEDMVEDLEPQWLDEEPPTRSKHSPRSTPRKQRDEKEGEAPYGTPSLKRSLTATRSAAEHSTSGRKGHHERPLQASPNPRKRSVRRSSQLPGTETPEGETTARPGTRSQKSTPALSERQLVETPRTMTSRRKKKQDPPSEAEETTSTPSRMSRSAAREQAAQQDSKRKFDDGSTVTDSVHKRLRQRK